MLIVTLSLYANKKLTTCNSVDDHLLNRVKVGTNLRWTGHAHNNYGLHVEKRLLQQTYIRL